jgi:hypothetical protein
MAPRRGQSKGQRGQRSRPAEISQPQQQDIPAADPAQGSRAITPASIDPPTTPIRQVGPFRVPQYNPPPLAPRPASPSGEDFDFTDADAIPLSVPPAAGNLASPVKRARAVGGNQNSLQKKSDLEVWGESDEDIIGTSVAVILKFSIMIFQLQTLLGKFGDQTSTIIISSQLTESVILFLISLRVSNSFSLVNLTPRTTPNLCVAIG